MAPVSFMGAIDVLHLQEIRTLCVCFRLLDLNDPAERILNFAKLDTG